MKGKNRTYDVLILAVFFIVSVWTFRLFDSNSHSGSDTLYAFALPFIFIILVFSAVNIIARKLILN